MAMHPATVKTIRTMLQLTAREVAEQTGYHVKTVQNWEAVNHDPRYQIPEPAERWYLEQVTKLGELVEDVKKHVNGSSGPVRLTRLTGGSDQCWKLKNAATGLVLLEALASMPGTDIEVDPGTDIEVDYVEPEDS